MSGPIWLRSRYPREPFGWQLDAVRPEFIREGGSDERDLS
jgi:hypothetical protein